MKIMIADDHPLFAEGLKNLLNSSNFEIVGIVKNGEEAVKCALQSTPDVILMDIKMPVINGIEATRRIKEQLKDIKIIILTSFEEEDSLIKAIKAGASGYLLKSLDGDELIRSLQAIENGKNSFSPGLEDCLLDKIREVDNRKDAAESEDKRSNNETGDNLTKRQIEIIELLVKGHTYREIGNKLFLSERTIKYHMKQIKDKLDLKTQAQVIVYGKDELM